MHCPCFRHGDEVLPPRAGRSLPSFAGRRFRPQLPGRNGAANPAFSIRIVTEEPK